MKNKDKQSQEEKKVNALLAKVRMMEARVKEINRGLGVDEIDSGFEVKKEGERNIEATKEAKRIAEAKKRIEALKNFEMGNKEMREEPEGKTEEPFLVPSAVESIANKEEIEEKKEDKEIMDAKEENPWEIQQTFKNKERIEKPAVAFRPPKLPEETDLQEAIKSFPEKPSSKTKLWLRITIVGVVVVILMGVATFWYWFFVVKNQPPSIITCSNNSDCLSGEICSSNGTCVKPSLKECSNDADCPTGEVCNSQGVCAQKTSSFVVSQALFLVNDTRNLDVLNSDDLRSLLSKTIGEWQKKGTFTRITIKNKNNGKFLGLEKFFEWMLIRTPKGFYDKLDNGFTLFIFSQPQGNRLGFVAKIKDYEGLENLLRNQESSMSDDFKNFFAMMGAKGRLIVPYFRNASDVQGYTGPNFRYQTINKEDLGIAYLTSGNYLVFTSSWKSMQEVITKLGITGVRLELTSDLKVGDRGYEVKLLQSWLSQDAAIYPQAIISGNFKSLTKAAVIRFQEKYASDILAPQGLTKGNGIVDSYTRMKLNELYGDSGVKPRTAELTTDLRIGSYGEEVKLLQSWLAKDNKIYPQKIVSGYFGPLTKAAVIRFQEKYASDILAPQDLTRGTGIIDAATRKKLNQLYGSIK